MMANDTPGPESERTVADLRVGDAAVVVHTLQGWYGTPAPRDVTITKVGRSYLTVDTGERFDKENGVGAVKGTGIGVRLYPTREAWDAARRLARAWNALHDAVGRLGRAPVPLERVRAAAEALGITLPSDEAAPAGDGRCACCEALCTTRSADGLSLCGDCAMVEGEPVGTVAHA